MKRLIWALCAFLLLAGNAGSVTSTEWDAATHRGVLIISQDDWVDSTLYAAADSMDVPMCFNIADAYMTTAAKRNRVSAAWQSGHDIGTHTGTVSIATMAADEIKAMFDLNDNRIRGLLGNGSGGPLNKPWTPESWVFHGNAWTSSALDLAMAHYNTIRLQMEDTSVNLAYPYLPSGGFGTASIDTAAFGGWYKTRGRGLPILMANRGRLMLQYPCDACNEERSDTTGMASFLYDLAKTHSIAEVMCHQIDGTKDLSKKEFCDLVAKAKARGDIWITTPRKLWATDYWKTLLTRSITDTVYVANNAATMGKGTWADPAPIQWALETTWNRPVKFKTDQVYFLDTLCTSRNIAGTVTNDITVPGATTIIGPSTIKVFLDNGGSGDMSDALTSLLKCLPAADSRTDDPGAAGTYAPGHPQKFYNVTFEGFGNTAYSSVVAAPVKVTGKRVQFENCTFNIRSRFGIQAGTGAVSLRLLNSTFNLDTAVTGCGNIIITGAADSLFTAIGCTFNSSTGSTAENLIYRETKPWPTKQDTLANCIFRNRGSNTTSNGVRYYNSSSATRPLYAVHWGGNIQRSAAGQQLKIQLMGGAARTGGQKSWTVGNDSLIDLRQDTFADTSLINIRKLFIVTYDPTGRDTVRWGGIPLGSAYGTNTYWGSIGATQYLGPIVWDGTAPGHASYEDLTPWKLLSYINSGVIPAVTAATPATHYVIPRVNDFSSYVMVRNWLDSWRVWPSATRAKILYQMEGHTVTIKHGANTYTSPAAVLAAVGSTDTASDSTDASTWYILSRPYNLTDKLQIEHWMDWWQVQADASRKLVRWKIADTDVSLVSPLTGTTYASGLWQYYGNIGGTEAVVDSMDAATWPMMARVRPNDFAQLEQNEITLRAINTWPDAIRKKVRVRTK